jgi:PKD domain-containing protein
MSVRKLLPIAILIAAVSIRCSGTPAEPDGMVVITQTTTTSTSTSTSTTSTTTSVIPPLNPGGGGASASPTGFGIAAATVYTFSVSPPSGGVPPYTFAWNFGDGGQGTGNPTTHVYPTRGTFTALATATDSQGMTAQSATTVGVRNVSGRWTVTYPPATGLPQQAIDLIQNQSVVAATINDPALGLGSGTGTVSNPRNLQISVIFRAGTPAAFAANYLGGTDDKIEVWTGTVTGYAGCPCAFTASRPQSPGDTFRPSGR